MGLDVYLYKGDLEAKQKAEEAFQEATKDVFYPSSDKGDPPEGALVFDSPEYLALCDKLGVDKWGSFQGEEGIEIDSTIDPDNICKIGYFRSSYNAGGLNHVVENRIGLPGLYYIFPRENDEYLVKPNWEESLQLCNNILEVFEKDLERTGKFSVMKVDNFGLGSVNSEKQALDVFMKIWEERKDKEPIPLFGNTDWFSNRDGSYFLKPPVKVLAVYLGKSQFSFEGDVAYLVAENDNAYESYLNSLKIVRETIEYVLAQPDKEMYYLHWSG